MECNTHIYKYIPEKQEEYKIEIINQNKSFLEEHLQSVQNPEMKISLKKSYDGFKDCCKTLIIELNDNKFRRDIINEIGEKNYENELKTARDCLRWSYHDYIKWYTNDIKNLIVNYNNGIIPEEGYFNTIDFTYVIKKCLYKIVDGKIYVEGLIKHGNDLGKIADYTQPDCFSAEDTIKCFKDHNVEFNETLIKELFNNNDIFIHFGWAIINSEGIS